MVETVVKREFEFNEYSCRVLVELYEDNWGIEKRDVTVWGSEGEADDYPISPDVSVETTEPAEDTEVRKGVFKREVEAVSMEMQVRTAIIEFKMKARERTREMKSERQRANEVLDSLT